VARIAERFGLDPKIAVESISYVKVVNAHHLRWLIEERLPFVLDATGAKLIVVDSLIRHFGAEFIGRETLARRQQIISRLLQLLIEYADAYGACVIYTNQVRANPSPFGSPTKEAGGNILAYGSTYRIRLRPIKGEERRAKLRDAPDLPEEEATYYLTDVGLVDKNGLGSAVIPESTDNGENE
jgi:DNA repair protein RadA